jgi:hypothetical protein
VTSTSTYPPELALGAALRATGVFLRFGGFFFFGLGGAAVSELAVTGAAECSDEVDFGGLFLLNDGKPNQPVD